MPPQQPCCAHFRQLPRKSRLQQVHPAGQVSRWVVPPGVHPSGTAMVAGDGERIEDSVSLAPTFGIGVRFFPMRWLSIGFDIKDYLVERALASRRNSSVPAATFDSNWLFGLSVGFSFPTNPDVAEDN